MSNNHCQLNKPFKNANSELYAVANDISRLYLQAELSDLVLIVQNRRFPVHRVVLAARSQYFRALLYSGLKESFQTEIEINNSSEEAFEHVLRYIYKGAINLGDMTYELIMELLGLVHQYGLGTVEKQISGHLSQNLGLDNVVQVLNVSVLYQNQELTDRCLRFLDKRSGEFLDSGLISGFSEGALCHVISRDSFCASEIVIFEALLVWLEANQSVSTECQRAVLSHVRLCLISASDLLWRVRPTGIVSADNILDAMEIQIKSTRLPHRGLLIHDENLARPEWNASVVQGAPDIGSIGQYSVPEHIEPTETGVFGEHQIDETGRIVVRLGSPSKLNVIRMRLLERDGRAFSYMVEVSLDQLGWTVVADYRRFLCRAWQTICFDAAVIQFIRVVGTRNTVARSFTVLEFEACYTETARERLGDIQVPRYNVASVEHHATVVEGVSRSRNSLLNGETKNYNWDSGYTCHQLGNGAIVVQLCQPFIINNIRFLLWDLDDRCYSYTVEVSIDKSKWNIVADKSAELCSSHQNLYFDSQPVVFIRIIGTYNSANEVFHIVHLEACHHQPHEPVPEDGGTHEVSNKQ